MLLMFLRAMGLYLPALFEYSHFFSFLRYVPGRWFLYRFHMGFFSDDHQTVRCPCYADAGGKGYKLCMSVRLWSVFIFGTIFQHFLPVQKRPAVFERIGVNRGSCFCGEHGKEGVDVPGSIRQIERKSMIFVPFAVVPGPELSKHRPIGHVMSVDDRILIDKGSAVQRIQKDDEETSWNDGWQRWKKGQIQASLLTYK